ncbi:MAG: transposase family protein [Hydrogenoanaerobacterium sp.]
MAELLTVKEVAELKGCSVRLIQNLAQNKKICCEEQLNEKKRKQFFIPLAALDPPLQIKYYKQHKVKLPPELATAKKALPPAQTKPLEEFTLDEREQIERWQNILSDWQIFRANKAYKHNKAKADEDFVQQCRECYGDELVVSTDVLYRRLSAYRRGDIAGLVDKRGQWKRGTSSVPEEIKDLFLYTFLDKHSISIKKCVEATELIIKEKCPQLLCEMPSYGTFYRMANDYPKPVATLARMGDKAFNDLYGYYVDRLYDDMESNDYWIADGHTIDVITKTDDGSDTTHRLTLSAFIDARSGIYVGWVVTDNPSSDATLLALRKAIRRYGIPRYIYVDNGREYLNLDIGGMGHRTRKKKVEIKLPTPILTHLGITMTNALPTNAQAKTIEREFGNFTFLSQLFDTYCGSNVVARPEKLKHELKAGNIPTDGKLTQVVEDMIEGYFNHMVYNGKVVADRGKTRLEVYHSHLDSIRTASDENLNLMMMRSSRMQTIGKNGVYITITGEKLHYYDDELMMLAGKKVFTRYDPENLNEIRVYDEDEKFIKTVALRPDMIQEYGANKEDIGKAMAEKRRWRRRVKDEINISREKIISQYGHINMLDVFVRAAKINREGFLARSDPKVYELVMPQERVQLLSNGTDGSMVEIDRLKMIKNNEGRV